VETIVLLPAAATTSRTWRWQSDALAGRFHVVTPELPGHGGVPGPFTLDRAVAEVGARIDGAPGPVHLCGLSLSATVAVLTCLARPARVRSLVLSGGIAHPPPALAVQRAVVAAMPERLILRLLSRQIAHTITAVPARERAEMVAGCAADFRAIGKRTYRDALRELAHTDLRDRLAQVTVPTLVVCGARDRANIPGARELAGRIGGAELRIVPDARHLWNLEHPDLFTRTLSDFVDGVTAR
jgi:3-oxoadipate enol-lactonase